MLNRVVSVCSFFMVILSVVAFGLGAWWTMLGRISPGDGLFMLGGWSRRGLYHQGTVAVA